MHKRGLEERASRVEWVESGVGGDLWQKRKKGRPKRRFIDGVKKDMLRVTVLRH